METGIYYAVVFYGQTAKRRSLYSIDEVSVLDDRVRYIDQQAYWYDSVEDAVAGYNGFEDRKPLFPFQLNIDPINTRTGQRIKKLKYRI